MRAKVIVLGMLLGASALAAAPAEAQRAPEQRARREALRLGWLGISSRLLDDASARPGAAVVLEVFPDSPAERAGVEEGDTILRWNGRTDVGEAMGERALQAGDTVRLRVRSAGREREVAVAAEARPMRMPFGYRRGGDAVMLGPGELPPGLRLHVDSLQRHLRTLFRDSLGPRLRELPRLSAEAMRDLDLRREPLVFDLEMGMRAVAGAEFTEMNAGLAGYFGTEHGVLVLRVAPETPASRAGLQAGDVVVAINGQTVESVRDLRRAVAAARGRQVELEVVRKGQRREVQLQWER